MFDDGLALPIFVTWVAATFFLGCAIGRLVAGTPLGWKYGAAHVAVAGILIALGVGWGIHNRILEYSHNYAGHWMLPAMAIEVVAGITGGIHARRSSTGQSQQWKLRAAFIVTATCCGLVFLNAGPHKRSTIVVIAEDGTEQLNHLNKKRFGWPWEINGSLPVFLADVAIGAATVFGVVLLVNAGSAIPRRTTSVSQSV